ncbi:MAG: archease, partial [Candidatus Nanohaloarchaea archaeon]
MTGSTNPEDPLDASTSPGSDGERGSSTDTGESVRREAGGSFELLDHTSEIGFRAEGETLEEAFEQAGKATFEVMTDIDELEAEEEVELAVESESLEALLYDFVDELIYIT